MATVARSRAVALAMDFAAVLAAIGGCGCSATEAKFLRRTAVTAAVAPAPAGAPYVAALQETLLAAGCSKVAEAKAALKVRGANALSARLGRLSRLRNSEAHPDLGLAQDVAAAMSDSSGPCGTYSSSSSSCCEADLTCARLAHELGLLSLRVDRLERDVQRDALDVWFADTGAIVRTLGSSQLLVEERQDQDVEPTALQWLGDDAVAEPLVEDTVVKPSRVEWADLEDSSEEVGEILEAAYGDRVLVAPDADTASETFALKEVFTAKDIFIVLDVVTTSEACGASSPAEFAPVVAAVDDVTTREASTPPEFAPVVAAVDVVTTSEAWGASAPPEFAPVVAAVDVVTTSEACGASTPPEFAPGVAAVDDVTTSEVCGASAPPVFASVLAAVGDEEAADADAGAIAVDSAQQVVLEAGVEEAADAEFTANVLGTDTFTVEKVARSEGWEFASLYPHLPFFEEDVPEAKFTAKVLQKLGRGWLLCQDVRAGDRVVFYHNSVTGEFAVSPPRQAFWA